jgi:hypothetical protein
VVLQSKKEGREAATWELLWPSGVSVARTGEGAWAVMTSDGVVAGGVGSSIELGGSPLDKTGAAKIVVEEIPASCTSPRYFKIAQVLTG